MNERSIGKLITYIARSLNRYIDAETAHLQLSSATVPFLTYLYEHNGVHQDEMAMNLQFDKSSAARAVKVLQNRGYVHKAVDPHNRRKNLITVTDAGLGIKEELLGILKQSTRRVFAGFNEAEIDMYFHHTEQINQNLMTIMENQKA